MIVMRWHGKNKFRLIKVQSNMQNGIFLILVAFYPNRKTATFLFSKQIKKETYMQLVIAEKPSMAMSIAAVIGADKEKTDT